MQVTKVQVTKVLVTKVQVTKVLVTKVLKLLITDVHVLFAICYDKDALFVALLVAICLSA